MTFVISHWATNDQAYALVNGSGTHRLLVRRVEFSNPVADNLATVTIDRITGLSGSSSVDHNVLNVRTQGPSPFVPQWAPETGSTSFAGISYVSSDSPLTIRFRPRLEISYSEAMFYQVAGADATNYQVNLWCDEY